MSLSNSWIEIIILYSIIFIICVICCIKFCSWCKSDNDIDNVEIPKPVLPLRGLPLPTIHEVVELTEIVPERVELQIIEEEKEEIEI
jgi:hypothetical protein|tara:strand:- start:7281 stop:7541 length:261 start_codon:yes stop_codon:yes gene_type:complete